VSEAIAIHVIYLSKPFSNKDFPARDVIGCEDCIAGSARNLQAFAGVIDNYTVYVICCAYATHIPDVMTQQSKDKVKPIRRLDGLMKQLAPQNVLADQGYEDCVFSVMI
jgi:hypothetical protein